MKCNLAPFERPRGTRHWTQVGPAVSGYDTQRGISRAAIVYQSWLLAGFGTDTERALRPVKAIAEHESFAREFDLC